MNESDRLKVERKKFEVALKKDDEEEIIQCLRRMTVILNVCNRELDKINGKLRNNVFVMFIIVVLSVLLRVLHSASIVSQSLFEKIEIIMMVGVLLCMGYALYLFFKSRKYVG
ncbi:MAG: hypothetical protein ACTSPB_00500 [Candidatus Thorarchaeota archaeon]